MEEMSIRQYVVSSVSHECVEDSWEEGEQPETSSGWEDGVYVCGDTVAEVVKKVLDKFDMDAADAVVYDDEVMCSALEDKAGGQLSKREIELWKKGKLTAYSHTIRFHVTVELSHDELMEGLEELGIESYD